MRIAVFGSNGPTGRQVVRQALVAGHDVVAGTRDPSTFRITSPHVEVVAADVRDPEAVRQVVAGTDAVVSTFGVPYTRRPVSVYSVGITSIIGAMEYGGVGRLVCVSSTTIAPGQAPGEPLWWTRGVVPFLRRVLGRTTYDDMQRMEARVTASGLAWTIVRPGGLFDAAEPTSDYALSTGRLPGRFTSRADLADALLREAVGPGHPRAAVEVLSRSGIPFAPAVVLKEAFGVGA